MKILDKKKILSVYAYFLPFLAGSILIGIYYISTYNPYYLHLFTLACCYSLLVIGFDIVFNQSGFYALSQGFFFGITAYLTAFLTAQFVNNYFLILGSALIIVMCLGYIIAHILLPLKPFQIIILTLGLSELCRLISHYWATTLQNYAHVQHIPEIQFQNIQFESGSLFILIFIIICAFIATKFKSRLMDLAFYFVRDNRHLANHLGLKANSLRLKSFLFSVICAGLAGNVYSHEMGSLTSDIFNLEIPIFCLATITLAGRYKISLTLIISLFLFYCTYLLNFNSTERSLFYVAVFLFNLALLPKGIGFYLDRLLYKISKKKEKLNKPKPVQLGHNFSPEDPQKILSVVKLSKKFGGIEAIKKISFNVKQGEIIGLIGPNGSGKTTLLNLLSGLIDYDQGAMILNGQNLNNPKAKKQAKSAIVFCPDRPFLFSKLNLIDNIAVIRAAHYRWINLWQEFRLSLSKKRLAQVKSEALYMLKQWEIPREIGEKFPNSLEQGTKKRVDIVRALAFNPKIILLDEPTSNLADWEQLSLAIKLKALAEQGLSIIIAEHNIPFLFNLAHKIMCLEVGKIIAAGPPSLIKENVAVKALYFGDKTHIL
ncbi:MAG: ATP-binding cassette domain-containing protein [Alphaproteobacteria bacterium]|nr:ATP-binding cassette domain-containing protein [Alphaproteobacteria bacterium]